MNRVVAIFFLLSISNLFSQSKQVSTKQTKGKNIFQIDFSIRALELENDSTCWFAGSKNKFGYTNDYGKTWKENVIKYDTFDLEFRSISVTTNSIFILSVESPALLFKIDKKTLNYKLVYKETNEKAFYDSMQFWDDENGIAVGDPTANCMSIVLTKDGGNSWKKIACENLPLAIEGEAAFAASNTNISLVDQKAFIVTGGKEANVLVGSDYGISWKKYKTPIIQGEKMTGIFSVNNLSVDTAIIAGGDWSAKQKTDNAMAITKDGGNSWQLIENNPGYISCVQFIPKTKSLVASSTTGIYYSEDLAESWVKISDEGYYTFRVSENGKYLYFSRKNKLMNVDIATLLSN
ncbi:oxidoreductase [Flavobacteriales bacterium]|nr:oxidoreductase [Flavobacteriales bacterium]